MDRGPDLVDDGDVDTIVVAVLGLAVAALVARLVALGERPFHWGEARVGYWALRYAETGAFGYRPVAGGPLPYHLARWSIAALGAADATARLPVALVGGATPLVALAFRDALADDETVAFAGLLAAAPPLLYYSRALRGDALLAAFGLATVGLVHRWRAGGNRRTLYAAAGALALAAASSGYVVAYAGCWLLAAWLTFDRLRVRGVPAAAVTAQAERLSDRLRGSATPLARSLFVFLGGVVVLFAPRPALTTAPLTALSDALVGAPRRFLAVRLLARRSHGDALIPFVVDHVGALVGSSLALVGLAAVGVALVRYRPTDRPTVTFVAFWGLTSVLVVPVAASTAAPWTAVHTVAPLCLPAAVALARLGRLLRQAVAVADVGRTLAALLLVAAVGGQFAAAGAATYGDGGALTQYGQPADPEFDAAMTAVESAVADSEAAGPDVLYVGESLYAPTESALSAPPVDGAGREAFAARLPLSWYVERAGARTDSVRTPAAIPETPPPVVVASDDAAAAVERRLGDDYRGYAVSTAQFDREATVFVRTASGDGSASG
ncbi:MAG: flippase activity-associated protein Agl23 [Halolamina sp.]